MGLKELIHGQLVYSFVQFTFQNLVQLQLYQVLEYFLSEIL